MGSKVLPKICIFTKLVKPKLGNKLAYFFGKATGDPRNIERSVEMERQLNAIGIFDNQEGRELLEEHFENAINTTDNIISKTGTETIRESVLTGPQGVLKIKSFWDGDKLNSVILGGKVSILV